MKIQVDTYFDGNQLHTEGPYILEIEQGKYCTVVQGRDPDADRQVGFLMPAAVESHAHLFLDGDGKCFHKPDVDVWTNYGSRYACR